MRTKFAFDAAVVATNLATVLLLTVPGSAGVARAQEVVAPPTESECPPCPPCAEPSPMSEAALEALEKVRQIEQQLEQVAE